MVGKPLAVDYTLVYIFVSAQVLLQVDTFRTTIDFPPNTLLLHSSSSSMNRAEVSQHFH